MSKLIRLQDRISTSRRYDERLEQTRQRLAAAASALETDVVNLAMLGPWRAWSEEQQAGAIERIGLEALGQTGDPAVTHLAALLAAIHEALDATAPPSPVSAEPAPAHPVSAAGCPSAAREGEEVGPQRPVSEEAHLDCCSAPSLEDLAHTMDRNHADEWVKRCRRCGQHWYYLWREEIDFEDGDDPWWVWYARLTPEEAQRLAQANDRASFRFLEDRPVIAMDATDVWRGAGVPFSFFG